MRQPNLKIGSFFGPTSQPPPALGKGEVRALPIPQNRPCYLFFSQELASKVCVKSCDLATNLETDQSSGLWNNAPGCEKLRKRCRKKYTKKEPNCCHKDSSPPTLVSVGSGLCTSWGSCSGFGALGEEEDIPWGTLETPRSPSHSWIPAPRLKTTWAVRNSQSASIPAASASSFITRVFLWLLSCSFLLAQVGSISFCFLRSSGSIRKGLGVGKRNLRLVLGAFIHTNPFLNLFPVGITHFSCELKSNCSPSHKGPDLLGQTEGPSDCWESLT